jgi:putative membrane-bound dehydrogenase-like protein
MKQLSTLITAGALATTHLLAADSGKPAATGSTNAPAHNRGAGPEVALRELQRMQPAEGLEVTLFASEPQLVNPANMDIDARGRVWVTEGANYRLFQKWGKLRPEGDRIVILEDTNGDGRADVSKTFYQGNEINSALGICVLGNKVIVSCSPKIFVFTDANGDDKADGAPEVWFNGIGGVDHDHGAHAFVFGPDGKLYFNVGNDGKQLKTPDGKEFIVDKAGNQVTGHGKPYRQGLVFRCNLDGSGVETLGWNFRNNYEVAVDSFGTLWQSDNDDDGNRSVRINYVMEFGNYGFTDEITGAGWGTGWRKANEKAKLSDDEKPRFHWHQDDPGVVPNLLVTGAGSPTGITVYEGKLLPKVFHGQMIHCDAGPRVVRAYPVKKNGAGYSATMTNVLTSGDNWFRPSDVTVASDGSLFVADWNDSGVGGHNMGDRELAIMRGRIYRVAPKGHAYRVPKVDVSTPAGAVAALQSPNSATRYLAWTALHQMGTKAERPLNKLWKSDEPHLRARALHLLARIDGQAQKRVDAALKDKNPDIRITALRIARERGLDVIPLVKKLATDKSPEVRRECAIALRHNNAPEAPALWAQLAKQHDGKDRWYLEALGIGAHKQEEKFFNAWLESVKGNWDTPAGRDIVWRSRTSKAVPMLVKIITAKDTSATEKDRYLRSLDYISGPEKEQALVEIATGSL